MNPEGRTYYAVPTHYSIGDEFEDLAVAVMHAKATVRRFFYPSAEVTDAPLGSSRYENNGLAFYSRAFIDRRVKDATGDRPIERIEVFLTDAEKDALAETARP